MMGSSLPDNRLILIKMWLMYNLFTLICQRVTFPLYEREMWWRTPADLIVPLQITVFLSLLRPTLELAINCLFTFPVRHRQHPGPRAWRRNESVCGCVCVRTDTTGTQVDWTLPLVCSHIR